MNVNPIVWYMCLYTGPALSVVRAQQAGSGGVSTVPCLAVCLWPPARTRPRGTARSASTRETKSKVNGFVSLCEHALCESVCVYVSKSAIKCLFVSVCFSQVWISVVCVCILVICVGMSAYVCLRAMSTCMRVCVCVFNSRVHYICHHSMHIFMFLNELVNS